MERFVDERDGDIPRSVAALSQGFEHAFTQSWQWG
jgi:hypothetical protein